MRPEELICPTPQGLYCPPADVYIDPMRPVARALITHGHSDHARAGHGAVMATAETLGIMTVRYGEDFTESRQPVAFGERVTVNGVAISFHPAGHVLGSTQILLEWQGFRAVVSGDYKRLPDRTAGMFEPLRCELFISEATFGLPVFCHPPTEHEVAKLLESVELFPERAHLVGAYPLGKAQRLMALIHEAGYDKPIYMHGAIQRLTEFYQSRGIALGDIRPVDLDERKSLGGAIVICPPSAMQEAWSRKFPDPVTAFASGWMRVRARAKQKGVELPLVVSDHADWNDLGRTIRETRAEQVWVTHGAEEALVHWCETQGIAARPLRLIGYGDEEGEAA